MVTNPIKAFEKALRNRPEEVSSYIIQDYVGDFQKVEHFFVNEVIIPDLREGGFSLSDFRFEYQLKRLSSQENRKN